nr:hypothetical protein [Tanacetum cinerariifolium]
MMIYLKNMAGFKMEFFKAMSYQEIIPLFKEEYNKVQTLFKEGPEIDAERIKAQRKRTRKKNMEKDQIAKKQKVDELEKENAEKQKLEEQQDTKELKRNLKIVPDDEDDVFVNVAPLSSKPLTIVDYKIYKKGKKEHFYIIIENGNHHMYLAFSTMLKNFDREDLEVLWKIVKDRFEECQPKEVLDVFLWHTLKMYPLTNYSLQQIFNEVRLQVDYEVEMAYDLLRLNMAGFKMEFFKAMSYQEIIPLFKEEYNKVQTLFKEGPEIDAERIKAQRKRTRKKNMEKDQIAKKQKVDELEKENAEKQKLEEQQDTKELKRNLKIVPDDEDDVFVNVAPLSSKPLTIVDYKIYKKGKKEHFYIIIENGNHHMYLAFSTMLKNFDREDLEVLWKIVKDRFEECQPKEVLDVFLWHTLKVMFEHSVEDM